jgi:hypothetical protein
MQSACKIPQPPIRNACMLTRIRFRLFPVRSPLLRESRLFSFPPGTEMFHFPGFASSALCIQTGITGFSTRLGFPIRRSPDQSLVDGSPRLIAATRVLHRLLAPRHPSRALSSLQTSNFSLSPFWQLEVFDLPTLIHSHSLPSQERTGA